MVVFHKNYKLDTALDTIKEALSQQSIAGDGPFTHLCSQWLKSKLSCEEVLMTTSCTHALELALHALQLNPGEEVILPSYTYPSTANAVLLAGGRVVFSEVEGEHLTLDPKYISEKISDKTRAIIVVHYGGVTSDMDPIMAIAIKHQLIVIEDAAQSFLTVYKGRQAGTIGHMGCLSFHGTKDIVAGEGGALLINDQRFLEISQVFRLKGTNKVPYERGLVPFYQWTGMGSSYSPSDILMALLWSQLAVSESAVSRRRVLFNSYLSAFEKELSPALIGYSHNPSWCIANGHLFYIILRDAFTADALQTTLSERGIDSRKHFVPLHESAMGAQFVTAHNHFTVEAGLGDRLIRLPIYPDMTETEQEHILTVIQSFLRGIS